MNYREMVPAKYKARVGRYSLATPAVLRIDKIDGGRKGIDVKISDLGDDVEARKRIGWAIDHMERMI
jgi:hypothetical protein